MKIDEIEVLLWNTLENSCRQSKVVEGNKQQMIAVYTDISSIMITKSIG